MTLDQPERNPAPHSSPMRWAVAVLISAAIAISYLDRQTLPWAIQAISKDIPITNERKAFLDSAFLFSYGLMYIGGGWLADRLGTRRGFLVVMIFWSLACASHGFAQSLLVLGACRLLLGMGEGGGFPAATRAVTEWFSVKERATAMGIINGGTAVGAVAAPPLIAWVLLNAGWLNLAHWRWVFFLTGSLGLIWAICWGFFYFPPRKSSAAAASGDDKTAISMLALLKFPQIWTVVGAKFLSDAAWYFYMFWLPKYLFDALGYDIKSASSFGWIPYAASGVGCLCGGSFSSLLLRSGGTVNRARKVALGASAALMPWVMFVPHIASVTVVMFVFSLAFFGQQSWSTLVMVLPTDLVPAQAVGKVAGLVGFGGAMGGIAFGQFAGWMLDNGYTYSPVLAVAAMLHVAAFILICVAIPVLQPLRFSAR